VNNTVLLFECVRCCREVSTEECYLLFGRKHCRACKITIENDPDYNWIFENILGKLWQIEQ